MYNMLEKHLARNAGDLSAWTDFFSFNHTLMIIKGQAVADSMVAAVDDKSETVFLGLFRTTMSLVRPVVLS